MSLTVSPADLTCFHSHRDHDGACPAGHLHRPGPDDLPGGFSTHIGRELPGQAVVHLQQELALRQLLVDLNNGVIDQYADR